MTDIYHVLNRGIEKRDIVKDDKDRTRFVHDLYVLNDRNYVDANHRFDSGSNKPERQQLVRIHAWCLMKNHYHLLLSPIDDDLSNLSLFMKKLNMGYAKYFNERYGRSGYLWQGKYKKLLIHRDAYFLYIPYYLHLNPLDYVFSEWRTGQVQDVEKAFTYLFQYRWSSFLDYSGIKNFPSIIDKRVMSEILGGEAAQRRNIERIVQSPDLAAQGKKIE